MQFPCTKCGICCQNITHIQVLKEFDMGNGICKHFDVETKQCQIYDKRPEICNIEKMYEKYYYRFYTKDMFHSINAKACNIMQENAGIDKSYRVNLE